MTYLEKLKDVRWQEVRSLVIDRDSEKCQICELEQKLNVHHTIYLKGKEPWDYPLEYLITLCENCHLDTETNIDKIKHLLSFIQQERPWFLDNIRVMLERELSEDGLYKYQKIKFNHE